MKILSRASVAYRTQGISPYVGHDTLQNGVLEHGKPLTIYCSQWYEGQPGSGYFTDKATIDSCINERGVLDSNKLGSALQTQASKYNYYINGNNFAAVAESSEASVQEKRRKRRITKLQKNIYDIEQTIKVVQEAYYLIKDIPNIELLKQIEVNDEETMENLCDASYRQVTDNGGWLIASLGFRERNKDLGFTNIFVFSEYKQQLVNNYLSDMERYRKTIADCKTELEALTS